VLWVIRFLSPLSHDEDPANWGMLNFFNRFDIFGDTYNSYMFFCQVLRQGLWRVAWLVSAAWPCSASAATQPSAAVVAVRNVTPADLQQYMAPTDHVLADLRAGLRKLQRLCAVPSPVDKALEPLTFGNLEGLRVQFEQARVRLLDAQRQTQLALEAFERQSGVGQMPWCQVSPTWLPVCSGYRTNLQLLAKAKDMSARLFSEAQQRLEVYDQYAALEDRQCTSRGFTRRLWLTEETYLWPLVMGAPTFFNRILRAP